MVPLFCVPLCRAHWRTQIIYYFCLLSVEFVISALSVLIYNKQLFNHGAPDDITLVHSFTLQFKTYILMTRLCNVNFELLRFTSFAA